MVYMAMNIKNPEAHRLAHELAKLMGTSITEAIIQALREKLGRTESPQTRLEEMERIARDFASLLTPEQKAVNVDDLLYDELGMPK